MQRGILRTCSCKMLAGIPVDPWDEKAARLCSLVGKSRQRAKGNTHRKYRVVRNFGASIKPPNGFFRVSPSVCLFVSLSQTVIMYAFSPFLAFFCFSLQMLARY